jgi:hypothetical protein
MNVTTSLKRNLSKVPVLGSAAKRIHRAFVGGATGLEFTGSSDYWEARYSNGGNSGAGSYTNLSLFKAEVLNNFVREHDVKTVIELGCGDGAQLSLAEYPDYLGLDVSRTVVEHCSSKFANDPSKKFEVIGEGLIPYKAELVLSLDVIYHLVEDDIFHEYMAHCFDAAQKYVIIYASNDDLPSPAPHVRHRLFSTWIEESRADWQQIGFIKNRYPWNEKDQRHTSFADFYVYERR